MRSPTCPPKLAERRRKGAAWWAHKGSNPGPLPCASTHRKLISQYLCRAGGFRGQSSAGSHKSFQTIARLIGLALLELVHGRSTARYCRSHSRPSRANYVYIACRGGAQEGARYHRATAASRPTGYRGELVSAP